MSDARWSDIDADVAAAAEHFTNATALFDLGGFELPGLDGYRTRMGFMHGMQVDHTSLENALIHISEMLGEERPTGHRWHADLIRRIARARAGVRPAILSPALADASDHTRRFRKLAMHGYDTCSHSAATDAVHAARELAAGLTTAIDAFRDAIEAEPPPGPPGVA